MKRKMNCIIFTAASSLLANISNFFTVLSKSITNLNNYETNEKTPDSKSHEIISKFHTVAGEFLYPLLCHWDTNKKTLLLETMDKDILCRIISLTGQIISNLEW